MSEERETFEPARRSQRSDRRLVRGVGEGEEQADGKRPRARGHNLVQDRPDLRRIQRHQRLAVRGHPFGGLEAQIVGDGQPARRKRQPVERGPRLPADGEHVAEAGCGDQRRPRARCSSTALVATVVPCETIASEATPSAASPPNSATEGSARVESSLKMRTAPPSQ